mmetsp:Transcript_11981/g.28058  ORF Transcript_11981/g.28058 Transcript_11981/m.28058 type:complete len:402 (+) Transcript_11981:195-1400(+)
MSLGLGFEYQGLPPQPVITVIEPGGPADRAGVRLGEIIVEVDSQRITGLTDVRQLLVNSNPEVTLVLQQPGQSLTSGLFGFAGMGSLRLGGEAPRRVTIRRSGAPAAGGARRARQPEEARAEEALPAAAQAARERGRELFKAGDWLSAAEAFTEAMEGLGGGRGLSDKVLSQLLTNRALCFQKLEVWDKVEDDARKAMDKNGSSVKAHYLLGKALLEIGRVEDARAALLKSMSLSSSPEFKSYRRSIDAALFMARKRIWEKEQIAIDRADEALREDLLRVAEDMDDQGGDGARGELLEARTCAITRLLSKARVQRSTADVPKGILCPLSHRIMLDPVSTPSGSTYDRDFIETHIKTKGPTDPINPSEKVSLEKLVPNLSLKHYIDDFLEANPWAFDEDTYG